MSAAGDSHPFAVGQIWRRVQEPDELLIVFRVDNGDPSIAVLHAQATPADEVHPFDLSLITNTPTDLVKWELAEWRTFTNWPAEPT